MRLILLSLLLLFPAAAHAACSSPSGNAGDITWNNTNSIIWCDGSAWYSLRDAANNAGTPGGSTGHIQFKSGTAFAGDTALFWDNSAKRLGVRTAAPLYNLDVNGNARISTEAGGLTLEGITHSYLQFYPRAIAAGRKAWIGFGNVGHVDFTIVNEDTGHIILRPVNGNVGIHTSTPQAALDVSGSIRTAAGQNFKIRYGTGSVSVNAGTQNGWTALTNISYGHTFTGTPVVNITGTNHGGFLDALIPTAISRTTSTFSLYLFNASNTTASGTYTFNWTAIGE